MNRKFAGDNKGGPLSMRQAVSQDNPHVSSISVAKPDHTPSFLTFDKIEFHEIKVKAKFTQER